MSSDDNCLFCFGAGKRNPHRYDDNAPLDRAINESYRYQALLYQAWRALRAQTKGLQRQRRLIKRLQAERALLVTRAENAEAALVEADERHSRYVKAVGELAGMAARLAEADAMLMDALPAVQSRIRKHQRSWEAAMKRGDEFHTRKHCEQMNKDLALEARIDAHLSRKEQE